MFSLVNFELERTFFHELGMGTEMLLATLPGNGQCSKKIFPSYYTATNLVYNKQL
jgi:hypothetical protein